MTVVWAGVLMLALLWPSHALSPLDGVPLDGRAEAMIIGLAVPILIWLQRPFLARPLVRVAVVALLLTKIADTAVLTQQGLCGRFSQQPSGPYSTEILTIPIDEPEGLLRSWDLRADAPACTAIIDRSYAQASAFPAWFVNITDFATGGKRAFALDVSGYARVTARGLFVIEVDRGMTVTGRVGAQAVASKDGAPMLAALEPGTHRLDLRATLTGEAWRFMPTWNGRDAFTATMLTTREPRSIDRAAGVFRAV